MVIVAAMALLNGPIYTYGPILKNVNTGDGEVGGGGGTSNDGYTGTCDLI